MALKLGVTGALIVKAKEEEPVIAGLLDITLIIYPMPVVAPAGIVTAIVPELAVLVIVPILVGEAKLPEASLS